MIKYNKPKFCPSGAHAEGRSTNDLEDRVQPFTLKVD